jgi:uncharacterized protein DUF4440
LGVSFARLALLVTASLSAGVWSACGNSESDEDAVRALFDRQLELLRGENFDELYANYSPAFRRQCTQEALVGSITSTGMDADLLEFEDVKVVVDGDEAHVTYAAVYGGAAAGVVGSAEPDIFRRTDGRWYDDLDAVTHC